MDKAEPSRPVGASGPRDEADVNELFDAPTAATPLANIPPRRSEDSELAFLNADAPTRDCREAVAMLAAREASLAHRQIPRDHAEPPAPTPVPRPRAGRPTEGTNLFFPPAPVQAAKLFEEFEQGDRAGTLTVIQGSKRPPRTARLDSRALEATEVGPAPGSGLRRKYTLIVCALVAALAAAGVVVGHRYVRGPELPLVPAATTR